MSDPRTGFSAWIHRVGRARRIVLFATPGLLVFLLISSANADHFGWGYLPWLALLVVLPVVLVYVVAEFVTFATWWLLGRYSQGARTRSGNTPIPAILRFDLVIISLYLVAWLTILAHDRWLA